MEHKAIPKQTIGKEFRDIDREWVAAYLQGSLELFDRVWRNGFIFTFPFGRFANKDQELADIRSGELAFESLSTTDMTVRVYGKTAVMAGHFTMKGLYKGRDISGQYDYTNVLEKQPDQCWQIVASHTSQR
jgi:hypothetical protein